MFDRDIMICLTLLEVGGGQFDIRRRKVDLDKN